MKAARFRRGEFLHSQQLPRQKATVFPAKTCCRERRLTLDVETFKALAAALTRTPVKDLTDRDTGFLEQILEDDDRVIDCSQLNELLLLVNKDRIEMPFFSQFFDTPCTVAMIRNGVKQFQKMALRRYGNFIYAYGVLSRIPTDTDMLSELGHCAQDKDKLVTGYQTRSDKLIEIELSVLSKSGFGGRSLTLPRSLRSERLTRQLYSDFVVSSRRRKPAFTINEREHLPTLTRSPCR